MKQSEIFPPHYAIYRNDRNRHGGGVFVLVSNEIPSSLLQVSTQIEQIWVQIHLKNQTKYCTGFSLLSSKFSYNCLGWIREYHQWHQKLPARIFLGGNFNASGIDWQHKSLTNSYVTVPFREKLLSSFHLEQLVTTPMRGTNILDLFLTSHPDVVMSCQTAPGISDHNAIVAEIFTQVNLVK